MDTATFTGTLPQTGRAPANHSPQRGGVALRIFLTVWLVYAVHFATDVVRETYLAITLGEKLSIRVDEYRGLHPDLFRIDGRGVFINNNPGASLLGAVPYALASPLINGVLRLKPELARPKPAAAYDDARPNRQRFMNAARARGLDIKLGLAAVTINVGLMTTLGAFATMLLFGFLREQLRDERKAIWLSLLYAFGTPLFFRSAFLNQNAIIAHLILGAYILAHGLAAQAPGSREHRRSMRAIGFLLGFCVLCDYSGVPLVIAFGTWLLVRGARAAGTRGALAWVTEFSIGAAIPVAGLLLYQWLAFGNPLLPAQVYMPPTDYSVRGWHGFFWPAPELLWRNLFDLRYGLFAFSPMLILAVFAPFQRDRKLGLRPESGLIFGAAAALYVFISSVQFAYLQWNTGVRYIVPAVPLLFIALIPVLLRLPRLLLWLAVVPTVTISWCVSMAREDVPTSLLYIFLRGFELPWLDVLRKTAEGYFPFLEDGASPVAIFVLLAVLLWLLWSPVRRAPATGQVTE